MLRILAIFALSVFILAEQKAEHMAYLELNEQNSRKDNCSLYLAYKGGAEAKAVTSS